MIAKKIAGKEITVRIKQNKKLLSLTYADTTLKYNTIKQYSSTIH